MMSEAMKIKPRIEKYLNGKILDVGCGDKKICASAIGVDLRPLANVDYVLGSTEEIYHLDSIEKTKKSDTVFSSHLIEHVVSPNYLIHAFWSTLKKGGHLVLYVPDGRYYDDISNPEHLNTFVYEIFMRWFKVGFSKQFELVEHGQDVLLPDRYSFYLVAKKI